MGDQRFTRREFVKLGAVTGGLALGGAASVTPALGNRHPHPRPTSLPYLDRNMYRKDQHPRPIGRFSPAHKPGAILFHTVDVSRLDRGFVIANPEVLNPDCNEPYQPSWVLDVRDPTNPRPLAQLPVPPPPPDAPYKEFCDKRGRFGPHNPPHLKAPGTPHPNLTAYTFFNAGLQLYDIADPARPRSAGYFIPPQPGSLDDYLSYTRDTDAVFVEWDRRLMWVGTGSCLYLVTSPALGKPVLTPMPVARWSLPGLNAGHR